MTKEMKYLKIKDTLKLVSEFDEKNLEQFINDHKLHKMIVLLCLNGEMVVNVNMKAFHRRLLNIRKDWNIDQTVMAPAM